MKCEPVSYWTAFVDEFHFCTPFLNTQLMAYQERREVSFALI